MSKLKRYNVQKRGDDTIEVESADGDFVFADEAMAAIEEARDEARQQWPVGSVKWADESGKRYRRPSWRTHGNEGWANCLSDSSDGIYVRVLDAGRVSRYESYYLDIEDMFALDYELEPEEAP